MEADPSLSTKPYHSQFDRLRKPYRKRVKSNQSVQVSWEKLLEKRHAGSRLSRLPFREMIKRMQVRRADQALYHHELTVSSLDQVLVCQKGAQLGPLRQKLPGVTFIFHCQSILFFWVSPQFLVFWHPCHASQGPQDFLFTSCAEAEKEQYAKTCKKHLGDSAGYLYEQVVDDCIFDLCHGAGEISAELAAEIYHA